MLYIKCQAVFTFLRKNHSRVGHTIPCRCEARSAVAISCRLVAASIKHQCHCEARGAVAISCRLVPASIEHFCHCEARSAVAISCRLVPASIEHFCHCEARSALAISCRLVAVSITNLCHCEPVRTLAWQSVLLWLDIEKHRRKLRCFFVLAFPIFTARAHHRHAVRKCPVDTCRHP